jgi:DNA-binding GntR family transcriptional regulator
LNGRAVAAIRPPRAARNQLRDDVVAYVRELIVSGQKRPGSWLPLDALADELGISATPVREALLLLAQDGWLIQEPNRGFRITPLRRRDVEDAFLVHAFAAGELAARAARRATPELLAELSALEAEMHANQGSEQAGQLNYRLHALINVSADSPRMAWFVDAASRFVPRRFWPTITGWKEVNEHTAIIKALRSRDPERARSAVSKHIRAAGELLVEHLEVNGLLSADESSDAPRRPRSRSASER